MLELTGLGDRLREARTAKGYTLEDLQSITKIQKRYLSGIENEDYSMMPGSFYVRAFIKQYAEAVDLNPDEMLALYKGSEQYEDSGQSTATVPPNTLSRRRGIKNNSAINEMMPKIIVALFIIVIIVVVVFLYKLTQDTRPTLDVETEKPITIENNSKPSEDTTPVEKEDDEQEDENQEEELVAPSQTLTFKNASGETSFYTLQNAEKLELEIKLTGGSWIGIKDETGKEWMTPPRIMNAGESVAYDLSGANTIRIRVGRPKSTEIYVNGELLVYGVTPQDTVPQNIVIEYEKQQ